jgi:hypothetical protein
MLCGHVMALRSGARIAQLRSMFQRRSRFVYSRSCDALLTESTESRIDKAGHPQAGQAGPGHGLDNSAAFWRREHPLTSVERPSTIMLVGPLELALTCIGDAVSGRELELSVCARMTAFHRAMHNAMCLGIDKKVAIGLWGRTPSLSRCTPDPTA